MLAVALAKDQLTVEPGSSVSLGVTTRNTSEVAGRFELEVDGLDPEWVAVPAASFTLAPGEERVHKVLLKPPRASESRSGAYPFVVRGRSLDTGAGSEVQAVLEVEPYNLISLELDPKRGVAKFLRKEEEFGVTALNLGNTDQNLQFFADDPEDGCTYQFASERIQLAPGQQRQVELKVQPAHFPVVGAPRLFGFGVSARGVENPHISANVQGQLERRSLVTPTVLLLTLFMFVLALGWWAIRPQPPKMNSFSIDKTLVYVGDTVTLQWTASGADTAVLIESNKGESFPNLDLNGQLDVQVGSPVTYYAYAVTKAGARSEPLQLTINPQQPPIVPTPKVEQFSVDKRSVNVGEAVTFEYAASGAERIILQPTGDALPLNMNKYRVALTRAGDHQFAIIAYNKLNQADQSKTITITVKEPSEASIISFQVLSQGQPLGDVEIEKGTTVSLEWQVAGAARAEITGIGQLPDIAQGRIDVTPDKTTTYTLTVKDTKGRSASSKVVVNVKQPPASDPKQPPPH